jgi:hypothetical protein
VPCEAAGGCGTRVRWYYSTGGKILTLDTDSHEDGNVVIVSHEGRIRARILTGTELPATQPAYRRHRCPPKPERPGPRLRRLPRTHGPDAGSPRTLVLPPDV